MPGFFNSKVIEKMIQEKRDLWSYINKPTAEMYEKVKHLKLYNFDTCKATLIKPRH